jgi:fructose-bisphosphate aldolase class I
MNDRKMQAEGLVPIVEPEILIDGEHGISKSAEVASRVLQGVIAKLLEKKVDLEACLLKIQMIMPGSEADAASSEEIAKATVDVISR